MNIVEIEILCNIVEQIEAVADYHDGSVTFPAFLLEILHNTLFPADQQHDYTEEGS